MIGTNILRSPQQTGGATRLHSMPYIISSLYCSYTAYNTTNIRTDAYTATPIAVTGVMHIVVITRLHKYFHKLPKREIAKHIFNTTSKMSTKGNSSLLIRYSIKIHYIILGR